MAGMKTAREKLLEMNVNGCVVSAIVEREHQGEIEILLQTRWKPHSDPEYSGTLEIPAGGAHAYENVYDAVRREVFEETGLRVTSFHPDVRTNIYRPRDDDCFAFVPFCCQQQLRGGIPRVGVVFVCHVHDEEPTPREGETRDIKWTKLSELCALVEEHPERVFTFQLPVLQFYLQHQLEVESGDG